MRIITFIIHRKVALLCLVIIISFSKVSAQQPALDTLRYNVADIEKIFLENNLALLAEKLNISQADALIMQAKVWSNPKFEIGEINLWATNRQTGGEIVTPAFPGLPWTKNLEFSMQLEQLIQTARKRKKNIDLQTRNKELAEITFADILQSLKAELRQTAAELLYLQRTQKDLYQQQSVVNELVKARQEQLKEGNISQAELYRIKALQISLQGEINSVNEEITDKQKSLKSMMALNPKSYVWLTDSIDDSAIASLRKHQLDELINLSSQQNTSVKSSANGLRVSQAALVVEKANRVPDIAVNAAYDRNGNTMLDFVSFGMSMDLPIFNRNKGNIKAAQLEVKKSELLYQDKVNEVSNTVVKTWADMNKAIDLYEGIDKDYLQKLDEMMKGISRNFLERNISLLEFLDFFESFKDSKEKYYEAVKNISLKKEDLVYLTGNEL